MAVGIVKIFCSRKAAKLAKKNNEINLLKNLRVFARDLFDAGLSAYGGFIRAGGKWITGFSPPGCDMTDLYCFAVFTGIATENHNHGKHRQDDEKPADRGTEKNVYRSL